MSLKETWRVAFIGLFIIAAYLGDLGENEMVKLMLGDLRIFYGESKKHTMPHIALPLKDRLKRETGEL